MGRSLRLGSLIRVSCILFLPEMLDGVRLTTGAAAMVSASQVTNSGSDVLSHHGASGDSLGCLKFASDVGGLALIGPTGMQLAGMPALLQSPRVEAIEMPMQDFAGWNTANSAVILLARRVSQAIRAGRNAVVHFDSNVGNASPTPADDHRFVCSRLSRILIGLADAPPYIVLHGKLLASAILLGRQGDAPRTIGVLDAELSVLELARSSMFAGTPVAVSSNERSAAGVTSALAWFESRRV